MVKNKKYYILPGLQGVGAVIFLFEKIKLPEEMKIEEALLFIALLATQVLLLRLIWILISSYIINISKIVLYFIEKKEIISYCVFPFFYSKYNKKITLANIFWIYDDRTCFSVEKYLQSIKDYKLLRKEINRRNRKLALIYIITSLFVSGILARYNLYVMSWICAIGTIEHFLYQAEFRRKESANGLAFASLKEENDNLMVHFLANQSKLEPLKYSSDVAEYLSNCMFDDEMGYFFNYLCLSSMFREVYNKEKNNNLALYMDKKIQYIMAGEERALASVKSLEKEFSYKYIDNKTNLFYENYREFLLYVLMYYKIKNNINSYKQLKNYIEEMLREIENKYITSTYLSNCILKEKFYEYKNLFETVIGHEFVIETSMFTGYKTLPIWEKQQKNFVDVYNRGNKEKEEPWVNYNSVKIEH